MAKKEMSFEESILALEGIVKKMEDGSATLEESLANFEEGVRLIRFYTEALENAEQKVKILIGNDGEVIENDFQRED